MRLHFRQRGQVQRVVRQRAAKRRAARSVVARSRRRSPHNRDCGCRVVNARQIEQRRNARHAAANFANLHIAVSVVPM